MNNVVFHKNCLDGMREFGNHQFSLASDDPPYFTGPERRSFYGRKKSPIGVQRVYEKTDVWAVPTAEYFEEVKRVSVNQIIWGGNYYDFIGPVHKTPRQNELGDWLAAHPKGWIVWDKCNGASSFNDFELAWTSFGFDTVVFKYMWNGMMQGKSIAEGHLQRGNKALNQKRIHPTEKPIDLYRYTFNWLCPKGGSILSNYVGSGADRMAAYDLGIDFTGFELDATHFRNQDKRFNDFIKPGKLFT